MEEPRGCGPGVSTGVCRGGDRAGAHRRSLSSLTCGFPSHQRHPLLPRRGYSGWDFPTSTQKMAAVTVS